jgi:hypothetical protein
MPRNTKRNITAKWGFIELVNAKNTTRRAERFVLHWHWTGHASRPSLFWGRFAAYISSHLPAFRETYGSLLERSWTSWPWNMGLLVCPERSVNNYQSTLRNVPEERRSHLRSDESLKSYTGCFKLRMKSHRVPDISNAFNFKWYGRHLFCNWWSRVGSGWTNGKT